MSIIGGLNNASSPMAILLVLTNIDLNFELVSSFFDGIYFLNSCFGEDDHHQCYFTW